RIQATPAFYDAVIEVARDGIGAGVTAPRIVVERAIGQVERLLAMTPEESPALVPAGEDAAARERVADAVRTALMPSLERYLTALREYLPSATETFGIGSLPGGDAMYAAQILSWTTLPLEAQKVHDLGVEDLGKIQEERRLVAEQLGV